MAVDGADISRKANEHKKASRVALGVPRCCYLCNGEAVLWLCEECGKIKGRSLTFEYLPKLRYSPADKITPDIEELLDKYVEGDLRLATKLAQRRSESGNAAY